MLWKNNMPPIKHKKMGMQPPPFAINNSSKPINHQEVLLPEIAFS